MCLFGVLSILTCLPSVVLASEIVTEANLSLQQNIAIDTELDSLFGPPRPSIAYRDYIALQTEPDRPSIWPLYKQQPAFAQGDFRPLDEQQRSISSPGLPGSNAGSTSPAAPGQSDQPTTPGQPDVDIIQPSPVGENPPVVDIIDPDPVPVDPPTTDLPPADLPGGELPTLPPVLPPWIIIPPSPPPIL